MGQVENKIAIISGGATLIGIKVAESFIAGGAKVLLADINDRDGAKAAKNLGPAVDFLKTDIRIDEEIDACINRAVAKWGGIDYLVNIACTYLDNGMESSRDEWAMALNTNLVSGAIFSQKVIPHMKARGGGAIVNFGSIAGKVAQPGRMLYSASKAAILGLTRNQALHLADTGIRVNSVSPGWTWSNVIREFSGNDRAKSDCVAEPFHLIGRLVNAEEVAGVVVFLCSNEAAGITGTDIAVDGGYTAIGPEQKTDKLPLLRT